ncbi:MAG: hypothetical protein PHD76_10975 [Methylacidiphilales bacterium]|nr:hypothetical protein [Candidatus Methylacidiphilales bacterium]
MKACFFKILFTALAVFALYFLILYEVRSPIAAEYWVHELIVVKRHLSADMPSPKIILLSGSNTLFGIDASEMEKELKIPAINFGLHGGMRLEWLLDEGRSLAKPGDILLLPLEAGYYDGRDWQEWELRNVLAWNSRWVDSLSMPKRFSIFCKAGSFDMAFELAQVKTLLLFSHGKFPERLQALEPEDKIFARFKSEQGPPLTFAYGLKMDDHGTILGADDSQYTGPSEPMSYPSAISPMPKKLLAEFVAEMKARKVRVYFAHSPYVMDGKAGPGWEGAERKFQKEIRDLGSEVIDRREQLFFPREYFFNTKYHLNTRGKEARTKILIEALREKLEEQKVEPTP